MEIEEGEIERGGGDRDRSLDREEREIERGGGNSTTSRLPVK